MPKGVYKRNKLHIEICRKARLGKEPWNKGLVGVMPIPWNKGLKGLPPRHIKPHTEETKRIISESRKGIIPNRIYKVNDLTKEKIRNSLRKGFLNKCLTCNKEFYTSRSDNKKYCSNKCYGLDRRGIKSSSYKHGQSRNIKTGYYSQEYKNWRTSVFQRDKYTCQNCGLKNIHLNAHHIKEFINYPDLRFNINNGLTLCKKCHLNLHKNKVIRKKCVPN